MNNRPFYSTNTNVYDQSVFSTVPTNFYGQNVLVSQEQQRKVLDTLNTSIAGLPYNSPTTNQFTGPYMQAQRQFVPGGVMFSFNPPTMPLPQGYLTQQVSFPCPTPCSAYPMSLEQQIAASGLQRHGLESMQYQQQLANNPFQLKFHLNNSTSCSDLLNYPTQVPGSRVAHLQNQEQRMELANNWFANFPQPPTIDSRNIKRLNVSHQPEENTKHVADAIESTNTESTDPKKKVSFKDETNDEMKKEDKSSQISCRCKCGGKDDSKKDKDDSKKDKVDSKKDQKKKSKPEPAKKSKKKKEETDSSGEETPSKKSKKQGEETETLTEESSEDDEVFCCSNDRNTRRNSKDKSDTGEC